jgi:nucleoside-diphosphate-sugar epimerase
MPHVECDAVFHMASPASPVGYGKYPLETLHVNAMGTWRALEIARASRAKFLLTSTSEVYGDPLVHPQTEEYFGNVDPVGPRACYDEGKRYAEALTTFFAREHDVDARIVRIFNVYGPWNRHDDGRMVPTLVSQALTGQPMSVFGDGMQTRSLCYVEDMIRGLQLVLFSQGTRGEIYNVGNPGEHTVMDYATIIKQLTRTTSEIAHLPERPQEIARRKPDITKIKSQLGWEPRVGLEDGLARTIDWLREELQAEAARTGPAVLA